MKCPFCAYTESKVIDSRPAEEGATIRRRRECLACQKRFTTYEIIERLPLVVVKRDGSRQSFDKVKLINGMVRACEKRPVSLQTLEKIADDIEQELQSNLEREISTVSIGEMVMNRLKDVDEVAYVRFASVYRSFKDINTFILPRSQVNLRDKGGPVGLWLEKAFPLTLSLRKDKPPTAGPRERDKAWFRVSRGHSPAPALPAARPSPDQVPVGGLGE